MDRDSDGHRIVRIVAQLRADQAHESVHCGRRGRQQQQRQGDLSCDQKAMRAFPAPSAGGSTRARLHELRDLRL